MARMSPGDLWTPHPELALGGGDRHLTPDGVAVSLRGEMFDDTGLLANPAAIVAEYYRDDALDRLAWVNGSFAAVICDPARGRVCLVSDRHGTHTLFLWHDGARFAAASRLEALLADPRVSRRLGVQGITELLCFQRTVADHTQYADIGALPAASVWTLSEGRLQRRQTRRLAWRRPDFTQREGARLLAVAMRRAVARRTADSRRHGLLLSGGLDARWILAAARDNGRHLPCVTTGPYDNPEVAIARASAARAGMKFTFVENPPEGLADGFDAAVSASDGLFQAPINLFGLMPGLAREHDVLLSGHGLDYTLRGYYLPCAMLRVAGSVTRLPRLRAIPDGAPATVARLLRISPSRRVVQQILRPQAAAAWDERRDSAMAEALAMADIENPYDAWDAFILHSLGRHYAYSDFVAMQTIIPHRAVCFDPELFDIYLAMPPAWRASGRMAQAAMRLVGGDLMTLPDANSGLPAHIGFGVQIPLLLARAALRRIGLFRAPPPPSPTTSHGSWANYDELLRRDPTFRKRLEGLADDPALNDTGLFEPKGIRAVVTEHLERVASHKRLLMQLLSLTSWLGQHGYDGIDSGR